MEKIRLAEEARALAAAEQHSVNPLAWLDVRMRVCEPACVHSMCVRACLRALDVRAWGLLDVRARSLACVRACVCDTGIQGCGACLLRVCDYCVSLCRRLTKPTVSRRVPAECSRSSASAATGWSKR